MSEIILYTHPNYNHPDVPAGSIDAREDNDVNEPKPGDIVSDMLCNALIARNGNIHYADDYGHNECATAIGFDNADWKATEHAMNDGYIHVAVKYEDISFYKKPTESQINALWDMYFIAIASESLRATKFVSAFKRFAASEGIEVA